MAAFVSRSLYLLAAISVVFGAFKTWDWIACSQLVSQSRAWPQTTGALIDCGVVQQKQSTGGSSSSYSVSAKYEYSVDGNSYSSSSVLVGGEPVWRTRAEAERFVKEVKSLSPLKVYYSPDDPEHSALKTGDSVVLQGKSFIAISTLVAGLLLASLGWKVNSIWKPGAVGEFD